MWSFLKEWMPLNAKDIPLDSTKLMLFVGPADAGKSYAATSFGLASKSFGGPDPRECYMLELDGRLAALKGRPVVYDSFTNIEGAIGVLNKVKDLRENAVKFNKTGYHTLIFDSFTTYNDFSIADSQDITVQKNDSGDSGGRKRGELQMLTLQDYGYEAESWRQLMYECLVDLKRYCNVILIAHEVETYKKKAGTKPGEPVVMEPDGYKILAHGNKISARMPTKFDEIYHFLPKQVVGLTKSISRKVVFQDEMARTSIPGLMKLGTAPQDISGKEFYTWWKEKLGK